MSPSLAAHIYSSYMSSLLYVPSFVYKLYCIFRYGVITRIPHYFLRILCLFLPFFVQVHSTVIPTTLNPFSGVSAVADNTVALLGI